MKQVVQSLRNGRTEVPDVPCPACGPGQVRIRSSVTLVSVGTERMLVAFGKAGWLEKARQQPDKVRQVLDKIRTDGLVPTLEAIFNKLDQPLPLGYCNVGTVIDVGERVTGFVPGDRVVSNGRHAEIVAVPANLCARVPDNVPDDQAAFTVLGAIALQAIRLVQPTLGETVAVMGLGLVGLLTVQLLRAHGCRVIGIDFDAGRLELARSYGAETVSLAGGADPVAAAVAYARHRGVDAVVIAASTQSSEPVHQAARMCRKRGRVVLVGVTGLELSRADFYEKELSFQVSCSYGPGRHDPAYEEKGVDYPFGFVRWTEQRNFEAVLDMMAEGRLDLRTLVSHRFSIDRAVDAYAVVAGSEPSLGILLEYPGSADDIARRPVRTIDLGASHTRSATSGCRLAFIGAGNYANGVLIPAFRAAGADLATVATQNGVSALHAARKHGFRTATTDVAAVIADPAIEAVVVATRHESHASLACDALAAGKHVFVEKPLALTSAEVDRVTAMLASARDGTRPLLMVGFNRRFSPLVIKVSGLLRSRPGPVAIVVTVNAGPISGAHWTQDLDVGGGRIVGEACHFIDLARHLAGSPIADSSITTLAGPRPDSAIISLSFSDGSIASIQYLANGSRAYPKERVEVFAGGGVLQIDNFRTLSGFGWPGFKRLRLWRQDKGQRACAAAFVGAVRAGGPPPIPLDELVEVARVTVDLATRKPSAAGGPC